MSSVRKQTMVISALIVLIVCASWFGKVFNDNVKNTDVIGDKVVQTNQTMNFFAESRIQNDNTLSEAKAELNGIINNKELSKKVHESATTTLIKMVNISNNESKIETMVKGNGFEDALCVINDNSVEVCVKVNGEITAAQVHQIKDIVVNTTKVSPSNIIVKPRQ